MTAQTIDPHAEARALKAAGISCIPTGQNKVAAGYLLPRDPSDETKGTWKPFQERLPSDAEIENWWGRGPRAGIARVHGRVSGNLETIDFDCGDDVVTAWEGIVSEQAPDLLERLTKIRTPRPGIQFCYRCEVPVDGNQELAATLSPEAIDKGVTRETAKAGHWKALIETRGEGGYAVGPGTLPRFHPANRPYEYIAGPPLAGVVTITAAERDILLQAARLFDQQPAEPQRVQGYKQNGALTPWDDFNARTSWQEILEGRGWTLDHESGGVGYWKRPGAAGQWSATTNYSGSDLLHVFSTSTGLESNKSYTRFAFVAFMDHGGDFSAAAKALIGQGYGDRGHRSNGEAHHDDYGDTEGRCPPPEREATPSIEFRAISSKELSEATYHLDYLIDGMFVRGQPGGIFGGKKSLKTTILIDLALSLGVGGRFLNRFQVLSACRVGVMSGESGAATIQETARRIAVSKGRMLSDFSGVVWGFELPTLGNAVHLEALERFITGNELDVLLLDPVYLMMNMGDSAGNMFVVGGLLKELTALGQQTGVTLMLCHHTRDNKIDPFAAPELESIAWAGFKEWVRQWLLIGRREKYDPEHGGNHKLWLNVGGSAGHSGLWAIDVEEGTRQDSGGRRWDVDVRYPSEVREEAVETAVQVRQNAADARRDAQLSADTAKVLKFLEGRIEGATRTEIRDHTGVRSPRVNAVIDDLTDRGAAEACEIERPIGKAVRMVAAVRLKRDSDGRPVQPVQTGAQTSAARSARPVTCTTPLRGCRPDHRSSAELEFEQTGECARVYEEGEL